MTTKQEYEEVFNKLFGTNIKWSKLSKEELAQLAAVLSDYDKMYEKFGQLANKNVKSGGKAEEIDIVREKVIEIGQEVVKKWDGPLVNIMKKVLND